MITSFQFASNISWTASQYKRYVNTLAIFTTNYIESKTLRAFLYCDGSWLSERINNNKKIAVNIDCFSLKIEIRATKKKFEQFHEHKVQSMFGLTVYAKLLNGIYYSLWQPRTHLINCEQKLFTNWFDFVTELNYLYRSISWPKWNWFHRLTVLHKERKKKLCSELFVHWQFMNDCCQSYRDLTSCKRMKWKRKLRNIIVFSRKRLNHHKSNP